MTEQPKKDVRELVQGKTAELATMLTNYLKGKIVCEGRIGLEAGQEENGYAAFLKVAKVKSNAEYGMGSRVLLAYYDHEEDTYKLKRYTKPVGPRHGEKWQSDVAVGRYNSITELKGAVGKEIDKL